MILIPVKDLSSAKQRLAAVLDQSRRTQLAQAMLQDVLDAVASVPARPAVALVTSDPFASQLAARYGFEVIPDTENLGETQAIEMATAICRGRGAGFTLVLPGDIPLVTAEEITAVLDAASEGNASGGSNSVARVRTGSRRRWTRQQCHTCGVPAISFRCASVTTAFYLTARRRKLRENPASFSNYQGLRWTWTALSNLLSCCAASPLRAASDCFANGSWDKHGRRRFRNC